MSTFDYRYETKYYAGIDKSGWIILAVTFVVAAVLIWVPLIHHIIGYLIILIHEFGHFLTRLLFGYPSVPAFDFREGGGVTAYSCRAMWIMFFPYAGLFYVLYLVRKHFISVIIVTLAIVLFSLLAFTEGHNLLCILAGHGAEILIAGVFLYRAMSGTSIINPNERPLYAFCGWGMLFYSGGFFFKLLTDRVEMTAYRMGKSYVENDLVKVEQLHRFLSVNILCILFIIACFAIPFAVFGINLFFKHVRVNREIRDQDSSE
jgi:hypothetical protein